MLSKYEKDWKGKKNTMYDCVTCQKNDCHQQVIFNPIVADEDMEYFSPKHNRIITPNVREKGIFHCNEEGIGEGEWCEECSCKAPIPVLLQEK